MRALAVNHTLLFHPSRFPTTITTTNRSLSPARASLVVNICMGTRERELQVAMLSLCIIMYTKPIAQVFLACKARAAVASSVTSNNSLLAQPVAIILIVSITNSQKVTMKTQTVMTLSLKITTESRTMRWMRVSVKTMNMSSSVAAMATKDRFQQPHKLKWTLVASITTIS